MTNAEGSPNAETRMTKESSMRLSPFELRHSSFVIRASFVIRHSSFVIAS
jgi:hypothetical protein